jgi:hypothetical protein
LLKSIDLTVSKTRHAAGVGPLSKIEDGGDAGVEFICMLPGIVRYRHGDHSYLKEPSDALDASA